MKKLLYVTYYRTKAEVEDMRCFWTETEFEDWRKRQEKLEPIVVIEKEWVG